MKEGNIVNILVVLGSPQKTETSVSSILAGEFMKKYQEMHPDVTYDVIDVTTLPEIRLNARILSGEPTAEDLETLANRGVLLEKFKAAEKIIIATPMWDFSLPGATKEILDTFCVAGETFRYLPEPNAEGEIVEALTPAKKVLHIQAMGGFHKGTTGDLGHAQVKQIMAFLGSKEMFYVAAEGAGIPEVPTLETATKELAALVAQF